ncbi:MAG: tetratricopeptide repeat protein [candidate division WOR-3 bacterium]
MVRRISLFLVGLAVMACGEGAGRKHELAYKKAEELVKKGKLPEAEAQYREAIRLKEDYGEAYTGLGLLLMSEGRYEEADSFLSKAIYYSPSNPSAHYNRAVLMNKMDKNKEAEEEFKAALKLKPDYPEAHVGYGALLYKQGLNEAAELEFKEAVKLDPECAEAHLYLGAVYDLTWRRNEAIKEITTARDLFKAKGDTAGVRVSEEALKKARTPR